MKFNNLQLRLVTIFGACLLITVATLVVFGIYSFNQQSDFVKESSSELITESAKKQMMNNATAKASQVQAKLEVALDAGRTLADVLSGIKDDNVNLHLDRDHISALLRSVLEKNPDFVGVYSGWEPNALDGLDELYAGSMNHDSTGRFMPYWSRGADGSISVAPLEDYENHNTHENGVRKGDYYLAPREKKRECAIDPYPYPIQGKIVWITSLVAPIMADNTFYGIAGVDMRLDFIQEMVEQENESLYNGEGSFSVISHNGIIVATSGAPDQVGKLFKNLMPDDWEEDLGQIQKGETVIEEDGEHLEVIVPLNIGRTMKPWGIIISVPSSVVLADVAKQAAELNKQANNSIWMQTIVGIGVGIVALMLIWFVARSIAAPIKQAIGQLGESSSQVASASEQISSSSRQLAGGASEQASSLEEVSSSLEEMASMTRQNADNAKKSNQMAGEARKAALKSKESMEKMSTAISEIKDSSDKTAKIVKTIDEIAFQTNLLALNAAVEAARAGDAGRGFAVVAEEVRSLAQRSADAAKNTANLIEESQRNAENGVGVSEEVSSSLMSIVEVVEKVTVLINELSTASEEQAQGIDQVNHAVSQMDQVTQATASSAEESASASVELQSQVNQLNEIVDNLVAIVGSQSINQWENMMVKEAGGNGRKLEPRSSLVAQQRQNIYKQQGKQGLPEGKKANSGKNGEQQKVLTPRDVIPLEDKDLEDF